MSADRPHKFKIQEQIHALSALHYMLQSNTMSSYGIVSHAVPHYCPPAGLVHSSLMSRTIGVLES